MLFCTFILRGIEIGQKIIMKKKMMIRRSGFGCTVERPYRIKMIKSLALPVPKVLYPVLKGAYS